MKKLYGVFAILLIVCLIFTSCGKTEATKEVQNLISAIGDITADSEAAINTARQAYDALSDDEQEKVGNYKKLEKAEDEFKEITEFNNSVADVIDAANSTFSSDDFNINDTLQKAAEIKEAYEDLSSKRKEQVKDYDKLDAAVEKLNSYVENAQICAAQYIKAFNTVNAGKNYTVTGVYCIKQIRNTSDEYHLLALTYKTTEGEEKTVYSHARCTNEVTADAIASRPETFFSDTPVAEGSDAVENSNVNLDLEAVMKIVNE